MRPLGKVEAIIYTISVDIMEEWRPVKDFPDYEVSNLGRVKSLKKYHGTEERFLAHKSHRGGYDIVCLSKDKKPYYKTIHRLVAIAFLPPSEKQEVDHINRNKKDNRVENLRWASHSENNINKDDITQTKYIYKTPSSYKVRITNSYHQVSKNFKTVEEAVNYRDSILSQTTPQSSS
jgi:hypothetical protein